MGGMEQSWYKITVADTIHPGVAGQIQQACVDRLPAIAAAGPESVAVFGTAAPWETGDLFLSPAAARILKDIVTTYDGAPCPRPSPAGLALLFGEENAFRTHLGARDLAMQELDHLERELRHVRQRMAKLSEGDPALTGLREKERHLLSQFVDPDFGG